MPIVLKEVDGIKVQEQHKLVCHCGSALFALGKTYKAEYKQIYIEAMQRCLASNSQAVYQAGIAIENLGECIFNSVSLIQDEVEMLKRAQTFLARQGS